MVVVVYNVGYGNIKDEIEMQWVEIYYDFNFNVEIVCYIFCLVVIKEIFSCLDEFGFYLEDEDGYLFLDNYEVVKVIEIINNFGDFVCKQGIIYCMFKVYNFWLFDFWFMVCFGQEYEIWVLK